MSKDYDKIGSKIISLCKKESNVFIKIQATFDDDETREWTEYKIIKTAARPPIWWHQAKKGKINKIISENEKESNDINNHLLLSQKTWNTF